MNIGILQSGIDFIVNTAIDLWILANTTWNDTLYWEDDDFWND